MTWSLFVYSDEYGVEEYDGYISLESAKEGKRRIEAKAKELNDGVKRFYRYEQKECEKNDRF